MTRGRNPTPTPLKVIRGNPGRRPLNPREPQPPKKAPAKPQWLKGEALSEWERVAPILAKIGLLSELDRAALVGYCTQYAIYVRAMADIESRGEVVEVTRGKGDHTWEEEQVNPYVNIADKAIQRIRAYCQEFGLTPSARGRMQVPGTSEGGVDDFEREYGG